MTDTGDRLDLGPQEIWTEPLDRLLARLATTRAGLNSAEVRSRLATCGPNDAATVKRSPLWRQFLARFRNPLVIILLVASGSVRRNRRRHKLRYRREHRHDEHDTRFRPGSPRPKCGRGTAPFGGGPSNRTARRRKSLSPDRPVGPWRRGRIDRRRSRSCGRATA